jgi:hypothetical protein
MFEPRKLIIRGIGLLVTVVYTHSRRVEMTNLLLTEILSKQRFGFTADDDSSRVCALQGSTYFDGAGMGFALQCGGLSFSPQSDNV